MEWDAQKLPVVTQKVRYDLHHPLVPFLHSGKGFA